MSNPRLISHKDLQAESTYRQMMVKLSKTWTQKSETSSSYQGTAFFSASGALPKFSDHGEELLLDYPKLQRRKYLLQLYPFNQEVKHQPISLSDTIDDVLNSLILEPGSRVDEIPEEIRKCAVSAKSVCKSMLFQEKTEAEKAFRNAKDEQKPRSDAKSSAKLQQTQAEFEALTAIYMYERLRGDISYQGNVSSSYSFDTVSVLPEELVAQTNALNKLLEEKASDAKLMPAIESLFKLYVGLIIRLKHPSFRPEYFQTFSLSHGYAALQNDATRASETLVKADQYLLSLNQKQALPKSQMSEEAPAQELGKESAAVSKLKL